MNDFQIELGNKIRNFISDRNWDQFHTGKDIAMCLSIESNEVLELFLWKKTEEVNTIQLKEEIGDVFYALLLLAMRYEIDIQQALLEKMIDNEKKYPISNSFGNNLKYNEFQKNNGR